LPHHLISSLFTSFEVRIGSNNSSSIIPSNALLIKIESLPVATPMPILNPCSSIFERYFSYALPTYEKLNQSEFDRLIFIEFLFVCLNFRKELRSDISEYFEFKFPFSFEMIVIAG